ncbi:hypothetical protein R83H12_00735 [Fibrobacteria bacterium R8-3-H12]
MKKLRVLALGFVLLALAACSDNLFGSSTPDSSDDVKSLRVDAENAFRRGDYKKSYDICAKIVAKDSTVSFGYFGMAKASLWLHNINPLSIFSIVKQVDGQCPFMGEDIKVQNDYFQAMKEVVLVLAKLDRRDTLTYLYEFHKRAMENKKWDTIIDGKTLADRLSDFRNTFCDGSPSRDCNDTISGGKKGKPFPLSDREYKSSYFGGILLLSVFTKWFLNFLDTNMDDCIAMEGKSGIDNPGTNKIASEWEKWGCKAIHNTYDYDLPPALECPRDAEGNMSVVINPEKILEMLQAKLEYYYKDVANCADAICNANNLLPPEIENLNNKIDEFQGTFEEVENVLNGLGLAGSEGEDDPKNLKDEIDKYKAFASFYKVGTHIDEDGDGCIDEELLDGQDNDGDSLINENSRLAPTDIDHPLYGVNSKQYGINSINNSMVGDNPYRDRTNWEYNRLDTLQRPEDEPVKICNNPDCSVYTPFWTNEKTGSVTILRFTQMTYPSDPSQKYWTTRDLNLKLTVAQDTACPPKISLADRKRTIGGCWPNYDECKFVKYWLKRELAIPDVRKTRVHPSCMKYTGGCSQ